MKSTHSSRRRKGFTLLEVMMAATISLLVVGMSSAFLIEIMRMIAKAELHNNSNGDMRSLTNDMVRDVRAAHEWAIYPSTADFSTKTTTGGSGNVLALAYWVDPEINISSLTEAEREEYWKTPLADNFNGSPVPIVKLVVYYRPQPSSAGEMTAVYRAEYNLTTGNTNGLASLMQSGSVFTPDTANHEEIVELAQGLAGSGMNLFHNLWDTSIMVNGRIRTFDGSEYVTNTYNFTVKPRL